MDIKTENLSKLVFCISFLIRLIQAGPAAAQDSSGQISLQSADREINVSGSAFHTFLFKIVNHSPVHADLSLEVKAPQPLQLISSGQLPLHLNSGDSSFVPVKVTVPGNSAEGSYVVKIYLRKEGSVIREDSCRINIAAIKQVSLSAIDPMIRIYGNERSFQIPLRIINSGNTEQAVSIIATYPAEMDQMRFHRPIQITLAAFSDTLIYLSKTLRRKITGQDVFQVTATGLYANGDIFGQTEVSVTVMRSAKYLEDQEIPFHLNSYVNSLTFSMNNPFGNNAYYRLSGGSVIQLPYGSFGYNIDATERFGDQRETYIRNTYLSYEIHNMGIRVGSINRNFDLNIYGSGIALSAMDTADKNYFEAGYLVNGGEFLPSSRYGFSPGNTVWGNFQHQGAGTQVESALVHQTDPLYQTDNNLLVNELKLAVSKKLRLFVQVNGGNTTDSRNPWNSKLGLLSTLGLSGNVGKFSISSLNTYSSPYYPGLRKGARVLSERISYLKGKINFWGGLNYYNYQPKYLSSVYNFQPVYGSAKADIGFSTSLNSFSFSFSPYYSSEYSRFNILARPVNIRIDAWRVASQVIYNNGATSQSFSLRTEAGIASDSARQAGKFQIKVDGSYNNPFFNLSSTYQLGSFYPGEALNTSPGHHEQYRSLSIAPMFQRQLLHNKLHLRAGLYYFYNSISRSSLSFNGEAQMEISPKTQLDFSFLSNRSDFRGSGYSDFQISLTQKIPETHIGVKYNTLEVILYKDLNNNNVFDDTDSLAVDQPVNINNNAFITDNKGKIIFKNLPKGTYSISIPPANRWYAADRKVFLNKKKLVVTIPVRRAEVVNGGITWSFTQFSYVMDKSGAGIMIRAADESGKITTTITDNQGNFLFYLPEGKYTIYIDPLDIPQETECLNNDQKITVKYGTGQQIHFLLRVKDRKVRVKKFTSLSMNN